VAAYNGLACGIKTLGVEENGAAPERILGQTVSPSMFRTLGVQPLLGRTFTEAEDLVDQVAPVVVLTHTMWKRRYGADPAVIGRAITLDRVPTTVIGVMPEDFDFFGEQVEFFVPLCLTRAQVESRVGANTIVARLKPGVSTLQAQAEADALAAHLAASDPARHRGQGSYVESLQRSRTRLSNQSGQPAGDYASALWTLQGAVGFVLLIACANVAGLLLARTASRRTEVALRQAFGASRSRITRQLVTEMLPLALAGAAAGVLLAWGGLAAFIATAPPQFPRLNHLSIDHRVLSFTALVALLTAVVFAMMPALRASRVRFTGALQDASRGGTGGADRQRIRSVLVTGQVALALVLLIGAGLMLHSFVRVLGNDLGADPTNLLTFDFRFPSRESYRQVGMFRGITGLFEVSSRPAETVERVLDRLHDVPGVVSVAAANESPLSGGSFLMPFRVEGRPDPLSVQSVAGAPTLPTVQYRAITRGFFDTMKIPLRAGRDFTRYDTADAPFVVVINETMARQVFPGEEAVGKHIRFDFIPDERPREIVGIVGDALLGPLESSLQPIVYVPHVQQTSRFAGPAVYTRIGMYFVVRTQGTPLALLPSITRAVAEVDRNTPVALAQTVEQTLDGQVRYLRLYMLLLSLFGGVSVVLAATGIYGVMAQTVAQRTREFGIRMALGARGSDVLMMVMNQGTRLIGVGLFLGVAGALALGRIIQGELFQVTSTDPLTYAAVAALLVAVAMIACIVPARRAVVISPTLALKHE
jgi:putative ABC transport system permease protein